MIPYLLKRFATFAATLAVASLLVFAVLELLPGNVAQVILGDTATPESLAALEQKLGLDRPAAERYLVWIGGLLRGQTALSHAYDTPTAELIAERLQVTLPLAAISMALTVALALALGIHAAAHHGRPGDVGVMAVSQVGIAIPNFWLAILLILLFAVHLQWVGAGGFPGWREDDGGGLAAGLAALLLPAVSLAAVQAAILARMTRSAVLEVMREDFVRTARAKGLTRRATLWRHVLRNALIPVVTLIGLQAGYLLGGAVVTETIFSYPGIGRLAVGAILSSDFPLAQGTILVLALGFIIINMIVDMLYAILDPRAQKS